MLQVIRGRKCRVIVDEMAPEDWEDAGEAVQECMRRVRDGEASRFVVDVQGWGTVMYGSRLRRLEAIAATEGET